MSLQDYRMSLIIASEVVDDNYYALIMAAMRNADTDNLRKLGEAFPEVWTELLKRYDAPSGLLEGETDE